MSQAQHAAALRPHRRHSTRLVDLLELTGAAGTANQVSASDASEVTGITLDSRLIVPGDLYVALPGRANHGARFADEAVQAGAVAVLTDPAGGLLTAALQRPVIVVADPRHVMAPVAARIYGHPSEQLTMFAVTGTNGKTTTSFLLDAALRAAGRRTGVIGTIGFMLDGVFLDAVRTTVTTPESPELQALLAVLVEGAADACVMEVSSHALALGRADAIVYDVAAFTNFGRDHLDFHGDEASYFEAKASLFTANRARQAVINIDDPRGRQLTERVRQAGDLPVRTLSLSDTGADYCVLRSRIGSDARTEVVLRAPGETAEFTLGLPGEFNVRNAVTALAMLHVCGVDLQRAAVGMARAEVPGRMQRVDLGAGAPVIFVDFAHTPQAVVAALQAVSGQRRLVVLGCGGDRDPDKREPIGAAAASGADVVIVTDDNPRSEEPAAIREQVLRGARTAKAAGGLSTEIIDGGNRRDAIRLALQLATSDDVVIVLGKGHEVGQEIKGVTQPFSDVDVIRHEWSAPTSPSGTAGNP